MRLSEAIRLGATMTRQCFGDLHDDEFTSTCAFGAAWDAIGLLRVSEATRRLGFPLAWEWIKSTHLSCPKCEFSDSICGIVMHLNDDHHWTREHIADFVELHEGLPDIEQFQFQDEYEE